MGFPKGRCGSSPPIDRFLGRTRGFKPRVRYNLIAAASVTPSKAIFHFATDLPLIVGSITKSVVSRDGKVDTGGGVVDNFSF